MKGLYSIVGMKHRGTEQLVASMPAGELIVLIREPSNQYDPNAIQVWAREQHVGYIKGTQAKNLATYIDAKGFHGSIPAKLAITADRWPMAEIEE